MAREPHNRDPNEAEEPFDPEKRLLLEAKERFKRWQDWEGEVRRLGVEDTKFRFGDADNGWQWPDAVKQNRDMNNRPCLTINRVQTIVTKLANESKQNPPEPRVKPVGDKVSFDAALLWGDVIRHIQYISNFQSIMGRAKEHQLEAGIGYWHITHDFVDEESFDQELKIEPLDWLNVALDIDIKHTDGADAMWGFIFEEYNRKEFRRLHPKIKLPIMPKSPGIDDKDDWVRNESIRVAQYYRIRIIEDTLVYMEDEEGGSWTGLLSEIPRQWRRLVDAYSKGKEGRDFKKRPVRKRQLEWYKIIGSEIIESDTKRAGKYIPIIRMPGRERRIQNRLHRAGIVRALKDPQRMYNYNSSGEAEVVALQTKTPWIVAAAAIEGNEAAWGKANVQNAAYLAFRHKDDAGNDIPPPQRPEPPTPAQGFLEGLRIAAAEMEMASGIQLSQEVNPALERTPKAIDERVRASEVVNYDFVASEMMAVRHTAVVLMDLAPHIYDTERVIKVQAKDGTISEITVDPEQTDAYKKLTGQDEKVVKVLFNPSIGKFAIEADVGPSYQTRREEAWHAFLEIIKAQPELMNIMGDLGFRAGDFPLANEIAERLKRNIAQTMPWLLDDAQIGPLVKQLQDDNQNLNQQVAELMERLAEQRIKARGKEELRDIEAADAQNRRLGAIADALKTLHEMGINEAELLNLVRKTEHEMETTSLEAIAKANKPAISQGATSG